LRLGLFGGTFDPPHRGHLAIAGAALRQGLDRVALVPARRPPHKDPAGITDPFHRFAMAALAADGVERLMVLPIEVKREGPSYTIDTVRHFLAAGDDVTLIMGADSLAEIDTWKEGDRIVESARIAVYPRRPLEIGRLAERLPAAARLLVLEGPEDEVSASAIRRLAAAGEPFDDLVPAAVARYIRKHRVYLNPVEGMTD